MNQQASLVTNHTDSAALDPHTPASLAESTKGAEHHT